MYKNEGNEYFKEKDYGRAVAAYSEGLRRRCGDAGLDAVLLTNRAAAHFHLGKGPPKDRLGTRLRAPELLLLPVWGFLFVCFGFVIRQSKWLVVRRRLLEP